MVALHPAYGDRDCGAGVTGTGTLQVVGPCRQVSSLTPGWSTLTCGGKQQTLRSARKCLGVWGGKQGATAKATGVLSTLEFRREGSCGLRGAEAQRVAASTPAEPCSVELSLGGGGHPPRAPRRPEGLRQDPGVSVLAVPPLRFTSFPGGSERRSRRRRQRPHCTTNGERPAGSPPAAAETRTEGSASALLGGLGGGPRCCSPRGSRTRKRGVGASFCPRLILESQTPLNEEFALSPPGPRPGPPARPSALRDRRAGSRPLSATCSAGPSARDAPGPREAPSPQVAPRGGWRRGVLTWGPRRRARPEGGGVRTAAPAQPRR